MSYKNILIGLIIAFLASLGALIAYEVYFSDEEEPSGGKEKSLLGNLKIISEEPALGPIVDGQKVKYYLQNNGNVFQANFDGSDTKRISSDILEGLVKVIWSPQKDQVITFFEKENSIEKYLYDYQSQKAQLLDQNIKEISWHNRQNTIAYQYTSQETNNISLKQFAQGPHKIISKTPLKNLLLDWPKENKLAASTKASGLVQGFIYLIDTASGKWEKAMGGKYGLTALWSPQGDKILFSETNEQGKKLSLKMLDLNSQKTIATEFETLAEKCVWSRDNRSIFCAVPKEIPSSSVLPDDYYKDKITFFDDIWWINLDTQETEKVFDSSGIKGEPYNISKIILSETEDHLVFLNKQDGHLYSLEL